MRKIIPLIIAISFVCSFIGCAKLISEEYSTVSVVITDSYHRPAYSCPIVVGKIRSVIMRPAVYRITVEYNDCNYTISGSTAYYQYKDKIGKIVNAKLRTRTYDDGMIKCDIVSLGEQEECGT
mgnify:CR=1 FL=1